jgi:predicted N-acetyltransferase YhbS
VIFAEHEGRTVGFVFGIPNLAQAQRGQAIDTVVVKTVAVLPGRTYAGLGNVLVAHCQQAARKLGFRRVIHALMHESNNSLNLSGHYAKPFRRYTLYSHPL